MEKERTTISRLQSNDLSLERFEKTQQIIQELKSEITQLKQDKFSQKDQLQEIREHTNQLDIENNQLTLRMKQLKTLLEQRDQTIKNIHQKISEEQITGILITVIFIISIFYHRIRRFTSDITHRKFSRFPVNS